MSEHCAQRTAPAGSQVSRAATDAPPPRALYVGGTLRWRADVRHGALELTSQQQPVRRFPLTRISRIVCRVTLDWSGEALGACLARGIPVLFEDGRGVAAGFALPAVDPATPLHACFQRLADEPAAEHLLDNWFRHRRREVLAGWWADWLRQHPRSTGALYAEFKRSFVYRAEVRAVLDPMLRPVCESAVLEALGRLGVLPAYLTGEAARLDVLCELTTLLWGQVNLESGTLAVMAAERKLQLDFLENWLSRNPALLNGHLQSLARFVVRTLRSWL